ncbi:HAD family hydrolase [Lentibacillus cibarius]|uniref:HAD family hydrolase n=1 Tax=Lentibacillus cibarius TaxID=2583219 RepID=A0A5S3QIG8_9BACI|nr:HAD family hydrolase [Lentibacillus cibarius]TMN21665.1 HAD family hydrolase [Lentibacillus cibarius]
MHTKAIALDMDGTFLDAYNTVDSKLIQLIGDLRAKDYHIFLATGRTITEIYDVVPNDFKVDGIVTANGMISYKGNTKIAQHTLDSALINKAVAHARANNIYYEIHPAEGKRFAVKKDFPTFTAELNKEKAETLSANEYHSRINALEKEITWVEEITYEDIIKVYFFSMDAGIINEWKNYLNQLKQEKPFTTSSSSLHNVEIMVDNVSKATGIQLLLDEYNISPNELMAVGDAENDLPMFDLAAHAVAMKNAHENIKAVADEVTEYTHNENGLYHYLNEEL